MDGFISVVAVVLILAYIGFAIWTICKRCSVAGSVGASVGFLCGGAVIIPIAQTIATVICWIAVVALVLAVLGAIFGG